MPISSYQTQNSYDELNFKPFQLDYSSLLKEASAKTSYWMEGAAKIQQAYSKITGLAPQFIKNKEALNSFNSQVKDQIKKLAGTDLGIQGNANQINNIIAPLYDTSNPTSEAILLDDSYNKAGQALMKEIEAYKTKDKGAYYSPNNEKYATEWYQKYMKKAQDPNASLNDLRDLRSEIKSYTPYHDYSKELETAITKCPENKSSTEDIKGYYITNVTQISKNTSDCIQAFLSPKTISQMNIDGYIEYGKNYRALGNDLIQQSKPTIDYYNKQLGEIAVKMSLGNLSEQERSNYETLSKSINSELAKLNTLSTKIMAEDYSDIEANYEQYAGIAYYKNKLKSFEAFDKKPEDNLVTSIKPDMVGLTLKKLEVEIYENEKQRQFDAQQDRFRANEEMKRLQVKEVGDFARAGMTKDGKKEPLPEMVSYMEADDKQDIKMDKGRFLEEGKSISQNVLQSQIDVANYVVSKYGKGLTISANNETQRRAFVQGILDNNPLAKTDTKLQTMLKDLNIKETQYMFWSAEKNNIEQQVKNDYLANQKPIVVEGVDGIKYSIKPENVDKNLKFGTKNTGTFGGNIRTGTIQITNAQGKVIKTVDIRHPDDAYSAAYKEKNKLEDKYYESAITPSTMWVSNENRNIRPESNPDIIRTRLTTILSQTFSDKEKTKPIKYEDIRIGRSNLQGDVEILLPSTVDAKEADKLIRGAFKTENVVDKGNGKFILKGVPEFKDPNADLVMLGAQVDRMLYNIGKTNYKPQQEIPLLPTYKGKYSIYTKKETPGTIFIQDKTKPNSIPLTVESTSELIVELQTLN